MSDELRQPCFDEGHVVAERYEILEAVGQGTTGTVYRARDLWCDTDQEIVALKAIHPHLHSDRQIFGRVRREVKILKQIEGPNLVKLLDYIEDEGLLLISLEYVDGPSLDSYVEQRGPVPLSEIIAIVEQICAALNTAHQAGIIHRDLKPSNVLVEGTRPLEELGDDDVPPSFLEELKVKVVDFGLAKIVAGEMTGTALTEADMIFGTPDYMSPEQVAGDELDPRSDVYAAAVLLYELVSGKVPFDAPSALATMTAHLHEPPSPPSEKAPDRGIPPGLDAVILRALSKKPDDRFDSAEAFARALREADLTPSTRKGEDGRSDTDEQAPAPPEEGGDTGLAHSETAIHNTLNSELDSETPKGRGAKVRVVVREGSPESDPASSTKPQASGRGRSHPPSSMGTTDGETRVWTVVAVLFALAAVAAGIFLGIRS